MNNKEKGTGNLSRQGNSENRGQKQILFSARGLKKSYGSSGHTRVEVLRDVDLNGNRGEMTAIVGASGSGKTTLLQIIGTLDHPDAGELFFNGKNLLKAHEQTLCRHRNDNVGFIFQFHNLLPEFSALENIIMPGRIKGDVDIDMLQERGMQILAQVGLENRGHHLPGELSGGEQQRVALARALIMKPSLLLADEPTGNLDSKSGKLVFNLLRELCGSMQLCVIMVTHNLQLAGQMDRIVTLIDGKTADR
jgi:lipoprotein-releasing system ATP-binding protein